jgi:hypothetical protein
MTDDTGDAHFPITGLWVPLGGEVDLGVTTVIVSCACGEWTKQTSQ